MVEVFLMVRSSVVWIVLLAVVCTAPGVWAQPRPAQAPVKTVPPSRLPVISLPPLMVTPDPIRSYQAVLKRYDAPASTLSRDLASFDKLAPDLQSLILAATDPVAHVKRPNVVLVDKSRLVRVDPGSITAFTKPRIDSFSPPDASRGEYVLIVGANLGSDCTVIFNGVEVPTYRWWWGGTILTTMLSFTVPTTGVDYGTSYPVYVRRGTAGSHSSSRNFMVVAPRAYRGVHGWKFANKGGPNIPWSVFRNYFGAATVEWGDGTHKDGAQLWYDTTYSHTGAGGNCFGMSLLSLRVRYGWLTGLLHEAWFGAHDQPTVWDYNSNRTTDEVWQSVQEMQGVQTGEPAASYMADLHVTMDNLEAWETAGDLLTMDPNHGVAEGVYPGHCTVCYETTSDGNNRRFRLYDNNNPYEITETDGPHASIGTTNATTKTFTYGGFNKTLARDIVTLLQPPSLPIDPVNYEGKAAAANDTSYLVVPKPMRVSQITDEGGNRFYTGQEINRGANRIPGAWYFEPEGGLGPTPDSFPHLFLFLRSRGQRLQVSLSQPAGARTGTAIVIQKGLATELELSGGREHELRLERLNTPTGSVRLSAAAGLSAARLIAPISRDEERVFSLRDITGDPNEAVSIGLDAARNALQVVNSSQRELRCRLVIGRHRNRDHRVTPAVTLSVPASRTGLLRPPDWGRLGTQALDLELQRPGGATDRMLKLDLR